MRISVDCLPIPKHDQTKLDSLPLSSFKSLWDDNDTAEKLAVAIKGFDHFGNPCVNGKLYA